MRERQKVNEEARGIVRDDHESILHTLTADLTYFKIQNFCIQYENYGINSCTAVGASSSENVLRSLIVIYYIIKMLTQSETIE